MSALFLLIGLASLTDAAWYTKDNGVISGGPASSVWHGDRVTTAPLSTVTFEVYNDGPSTYYGFSVWTSCSNVWVCYGDGADCNSAAACRAGTGNSKSYGAIPKNQVFSVYDRPSAYYPGCLWLDFTRSLDGVCSFSYIMTASTSAVGAAPTPYYVTASSSVSPTFTPSPTPSPSSSPAPLTSCVYTNAPLLCSSTWTYGSFNCGPTVDPTSNSYATFFNPGGSSVYMYENGGKISPLFFDYSTEYYYAISLPGTHPNYTTPTTNTRGYVKHLYSEGTYPLNPFESLFYGCQGSGRIYANWAIGPSAVAYPSQNNPSGSTSCAAAFALNTIVAGWTSQFSLASANPFSATSIPFCILPMTSALLYSSEFTTPTLAPGGVQTLIISNPIRHKFLCGSPVGKQ